MSSGTNRFALVLHRNTDHVLMYVCVQYVEDVHQTHMISVYSQKLSLIKNDILDDVIL